MTSSPPQTAEQAAPPDQDETPVPIPEAAPAPATAEITYRMFARTDVGQVREHNEDNFVAGDLSGTRIVPTAGSEIAGALGPRGLLMGVCDGMGGAAAGEVASQIAVDTVFGNLTAVTPPVGADPMGRQLVEAIELAGNRIFGEAKSDRSRKGMGTTATIATVLDGKILLGQVGDSRAYMLRGDRLVQLTRDQSLVNQLIEAGQLTEEEAENFEHANIILQALGTQDSVQVDLTFADLRRGDKIVMCSDGLSGMVRNDDIRTILRTTTSPEAACDKLIEMANQAGGHDNVTVVVAEFGGDGLPEPTAEDIESLKYRKFELSEPAPQSRAPASRAAPVSGAPDIEIGEAEVDLRSVEAAEAAASRAQREQDEAVHLPTEGSSSHTATMLVAFLLALAFVGYYLLRP